MIRPAKSTDAFALVDILLERHPETRYAGVVGIDELAARRLFASSAQRHGQTIEGGCFLMVDEQDGEITAFMLGMLSRVYVIGDRLCASDVFLLGRKSASPRSLLKLMDAYLAWADSNPRVAEIGLSWADTIPGSEAVIKQFERRGFELCSSTYRRTGAGGAEKEIAA